MVDISDLIGIKYKSHGRSRSGYDCYGLAIEVGRRFGYELPDLDVAKDRIYKSFEKKNEALEGDVIMFFDSSGRNRHIGIALSDREFIHCDALGVRVSSLSDFGNTHYEVYSWLQ